jgi:hypothetical protein
MLEIWACDDPDRTAELLTSELITNAVRHATEHVRLDAILQNPDTLRVEATDDSPLPPVRLDPDAMSPGGRGIQLVETLARRWGYETDEGRKVVWFETAVVPRPPPAPSAAPVEVSPDRETGPAARRSWLQRRRLSGGHVRLSMCWRRPV